MHCAQVIYRTEGLRNSFIKFLTRKYLLSQLFTNISNIYYFIYFVEFMESDQFAVKVWLKLEISGFYNGLTASFARQLSYTTVRLGIYNILLESFTKDGKEPIWSTSFIFEQPFIWIANVGYKRLIVRLVMNIKF